MDKRADGVILWTFVGYCYRGQWNCKDLSISGSDDLAKLIREELDAADAK